MPDSVPNPASSQPPTELQGLDPADLLARGVKPNPPPTGATGWLPPTPEELARMLPQYRIESLLGHGGMGAVYKGLQPTLDRTVAIKLLPAEMAADEQFISRFQREARTLAKLHHPGIVTVYDFGKTSAGHLYFVMEFVDGMDLRRVLRTSGLPPDEALKVIIQICEALQAAHARGVVHRDIKPENILITEDGRVKLVDFGIARPVDEEFGRLTLSGMMIGTPDYMSPEQRTGDAVDGRTDIYALGIVLYELLTGRPPRGVFPAPSRRVQVDVRIDEVVLRALQNDPEERYQNVNELKTDVDRIRTTPPPQAAAPAAPAETVVAAVPMAAPPFRSRFVKPKPMLVGSAALLALLLVLAGVYEIGKAGRSAPTSDVKTKMGNASPGADEVATIPATANPSANWHIPGLNEASFGGWSAFGSPKLEVQDSILTLTPQGGWSGINSGRSDFSSYDLYLEIAGSADVQAWVGVCVTGHIGDWTSRTSYVKGQNGQVAAGHVGNNFAIADRQENQWTKVEAGSGRVNTPAGQFFSLDFKVKDGSEIETKVNGNTTSIWKGGAIAPQSGVAIFVSSGSLRIRKIEIRKLPQNAPIVEGKDFRNAAGAEMVWIRPGTFMMGSPESEEGRYDNETLHQVTLTRGYWLGKYEVTQRLYQSITGTNSSFFKNVGLDAPVEGPINWENTKTFCVKLNEQERQAGRLPAGYEYGLPTEAQWEYACRAGTSGAVYSVDERTPWEIDGVKATAIDPLAWYEGNDNHRTYPVGRKQPNAWGLYDMLGNVRELCEDWYGDYPTSSVTDPTGPETGADRVVRGGDGQCRAGDCRAAYRVHAPPNARGSNWQGFRLALVPVSTGTTLYPSFAPRLSSVLASQPNASRPNANPNPTNFNQSLDIQLQQLARNAIPAIEDPKHKGDFYGYGKRTPFRTNSILMVDKDWHDIGEFLADVQEHARLIADSKGVTQQQVQDFDKATADALEYLKGIRDGAEWARNATQANRADAGKMMQMLQDIQTNIDLTANLASQSNTPASDVNPDWKIPERVLTSYVWDFEDVKQHEGYTHRQAQLNPDGTGTFSGLSGGIKWRSDAAARKVKLDEIGEAPGMSVHYEFTFNEDFTRFGWRESRFGHQGDNGYRGALRSQPYLGRILNNGL